MRADAGGEDRGIGDVLVPLTEYWSVSREPGLSSCYSSDVDPLLESSVALAQEKTPGEKLAEALELMDWGIAMQRQRLRAERPNASEEEIDSALDAWLLRDH